jgi:hypothetical protein
MASTEYLDDDELFDDDPRIDGESEGDLHGDVSRVPEAVVTATDWTAETVLSQLERGNIQLNPRFQRRDAWTMPRKSKFIESLFLGLPIPQLVLAEQKGQRGSYIVIDGKQRLLALRQFAAAADDEVFDQLKLRGLEVLEDLNGKTLADLVADGGFQDALAAFENQTIRTVVVRNWPDEDFLYLVFLRLNTGSVPLSPQELRQALHPGPFMDFADEFSADSQAIRAALHLTKPDFRMRDVELLIRFYTFTRFLPAYDGNLKRSLDRTCKTLNKEWAVAEERIVAEALGCDLAITTTLDIFGGKAFRRFSNGTWERRFNRAVFDVMVFYFRHPDVADAARRQPQAVIEAYEAASKGDSFQESLQTTTKSIGATWTRLSGWGEALADALQMPLQQVEMKDSRLVVQ